MYLRSSPSSRYRLNERARDTARAHFEYANQRYLGGIGSRLNAVRAQEVSSDERAVEEARLLVRRAQEALGVLVAADGPIDVAGEPAFELPPSTIPDADLIASRADVRLIQSRVSAARRRAADSWKEYLPSATALFTPQVLSRRDSSPIPVRGVLRFCSRCPCSTGGSAGGRRASGRRSWTWLAPNMRRSSGRRAPSPDRARGGGCVRAGARVCATGRGSGERSGPDYQHRIHGGRTRISS